jgi:transposase
MMGKRTIQRDLWEVPQRIANRIDKDSIFQILHDLRPVLLRDEDFEHLYSSIGRPSHKPSILMGALLLKEATDVSDREAIRRMQFDSRWQYALRLPMDFEGFPHTNLVHFRARMVVDSIDEWIFQRVNKLAIELGLLNPEGEQAIDSSHIFGAAAVQDTYELLRSAMQDLLETLESIDREAAEGLVSRYELEERRSPEKPDIDWADEEARSKWLAGMVTDARALLGALDGHSLARHEAVQEAAGLLTKILQQDITAPAEEGEEGPAITRGVANDRLVSTRDPQMRHGHKSASVRFDGHKAQISVDVKSELITGVAITPGNRPDSEGLDPILDQQERLYESRPARLIGDSQYGPIEKRKELTEEGVEIIAKLPPPPSNGDRFSKSAFEIDLEDQTVTCPAQETTSTYYTTTDKKGRKRQVFRFDGATCRDCDLREQCTTAENGRTISVHPHEEALRATRAFNQTEAFDRIYRRRPVAERKNAQLFWQKGLRHSRYIGRRKTQLQALLTATVVNLKTIGATLQAAFSRENTPALAVAA